VPSEETPYFPYIHSQKQKRKITKKENHKETKKDNKELKRRNNEN
jgi:hypothetical protein